MTRSLTRAVINLSACQHNLAIAKKAAPDSKCIAIIKADAYGHGMEKIAASLNQADAFGVAHIQEAIQLRQAGISTPIILLEGFCCERELEQVCEYDIESVIHNEQQLQKLEQTNEKNISIFLKVDSGMHRLGFDVNEVAEVITRLKKCKSVRQPFTLMTHLASADDKEQESTVKQIDVFYKSAEEYLTDTKSEVSIANSAGILGWPQSHATWNRPGILLYGVSPFVNGKASEHNLKPVMTLYSHILEIKKLKKGDAVGYGGDYICDKNMRIGIIAIGYGDGYPRHAKTGTPVLVNNKRCSLIGRVSMDMICVDLSEHAAAKINDSVVLWGEGLPVEEVAKCADTIAYELLCGVTSRVEFEYLKS